MTGTETERYRSLLKDKLKEIDQFLVHLEPVSPEEEPGDEIDHSQAVTEHEMVLQSVDLESGIYRQAQAALDRIEEGTFGLCVRCDSAIDARRLEAVPWAARCLRCQEAVEN
ncbi:MAG: TraR/DksA family transcriptional regulator, partial [Bryobacteraceae bacterium]